MPKTVLLRLSGPLQSYGTNSRWEERSTAPRPTKSAVAGIIANALGYERDKDIAALAQARFAVRADRPGRLLTDLQTAGGGSYPHPPTPQSPHIDESQGWYGAPRSPTVNRGVLEASWSATARSPVLGTRHYLEDAAFLAGLTTDDSNLAEEIAAALNAPYRLLGLGRRCCPPAHPVLHSLTPQGADAWPDLIPRLPEASTDRPAAWIETTPGAHATPSPEQVPRTFATRDHPLLYLRTALTTPPAPAWDEAS